MKEVWKIALRSVLVMAAATMLTMAFASAVLADIEWLGAVMTIVLLAVVFYVGFLEGALQGRKDRMYQASMQRQQQERGIEPTPEERTRFYKAWKGFAGAFLAASPGILLSAFMLFVAPESELSGLLTPVVRLVLGVYLGAFGWMEGLMPYAYLPLSLLLPAMIGLGYTYGPVFYEKMMKQIAESKRRRRRRKKKKTVPEK